MVLTNDTNVLKFILLYFSTCRAFVSCMISDLCFIHVAAILELKFAHKWFDIIRI